METTTTTNTEWSTEQAGPEWEPCRTSRRGGECSNWTAPEAPSRCQPCREAAAEAWVGSEGWKETCSRNSTVLGTGTESGPIKTRRR